METCFNYCSPEAGFFSSDERKWISAIHKLKTKYPDKIEIITEPQDNDGCIYAKVPVKYFKLQGPAKRPNLTEEEKMEQGRKLTEARLKKASMNI